MALYLGPPLSAGIKQHQLIIIIVCTYWLTWVVIVPTESACVILLEFTDVEVSDFGIDVRIELQLNTIRICSKWSPDVGDIIVGKFVPSRLIKFHSLRRWCDDAWNINLTELKLIAFRNMCRIKVIIGIIIRIDFWLESSELGGCTHARSLCTPSWTMFRMFWISSFFVAQPIAVPTV